MGLLFNVVCFSQTLQIDLAEMAVKLFLWLEHKTKQNKNTFNPRHPWLLADQCVQTETRRTHLDTNTEFLFQNKQV